MMNGSNALFVENLVTGNQAYAGGGFYWSAPGPILINNTIADNDATSSGSGVFANGLNGQTELANNIIVAKPGQASIYCTTFSEQNPPMIRSNNIFSAGGMACDGRCPDITMSGNISLDPLFADPAQGDYHLQQGSPSIDSGDGLAPNLPDEDLDGHPRILDGDGDGAAIVDMGVYEFLLPPGLKISLQDESKGKRKYERFRSRKRESIYWLGRIAEREGTFPSDTMSTLSGKDR
jgi:hypothetical protein